MVKQSGSALLVLGPGEELSWATVGASAKDPELREEGRVLMTATAGHMG